MPRATYTYAFKRSFVFGDENKCGTLKKEKLKRKCKEEYKTFEYCNANCPITKTEKDKISSVALINQDLKYHSTGGNYNFPDTLPGELNVHKYQMANHKTYKDSQNKVSKATTMAICVKPVYLNWNRAIWLVEFFEMYRLLGKTCFYE